MLQWSPYGIYIHFNFELVLISEKSLRRERVFSMHVGSKGWYVEELKKAGVRRHEDRKIEAYKKHVLHNLLEKHR